MPDRRTSQTPTSTKRDRTYDRVAFEAILASVGKPLDWTVARRLWETLEGLAWWYAAANEIQGRPPPSAIVRELKSIANASDRLVTRLQDGQDSSALSSIVRLSLADASECKLRRKNTPLRRRDCPAAGGAKIRHWKAFHRVGGRLEDVLSGALPEDPTCMSS